MSTAAILGQYEAAQSTASTTSKTATDKDTFLKLLVAQLTHQDPLNPVEDKEFIAQLAQFTQVEELQNIRSTVEGLGTTMGAQQVTNAASLMGLWVSAKGDNITLRTNANGLSEANDIDPNDATQASWKSINFQPQQDIAEGTLNIVATDSNGKATGKIIYSQKLESNTYKAGTEYQFRWHGRDSSGNVMPTGSYIASFVATDSGGKSVLVDTYSIGQIVGVESAADGNHKLTLTDGRSVEYLNIRQLVYPTSSSSSTSTENGASATTENSNTADSGTGTDGSGTTTTTP